MTIILPNKHRDVGRVLMPLKRSVWMPSSQAQAKDQFGNPDLLLHRITARLDDGHPVWRGWFEDREDFDAFLEALIRRDLFGTPIPHSLWDLPQKFRWPGFPEHIAFRQISGPWPDLPEGLHYDFASTQSITSSAGSNQSVSAPADWNNANNFVDVYGAGASGGNAQGSGNRAASGGGGGAWSQLPNFTWSGSVTLRVPSGGAGIGAGTANGNDGGDGWFNSTTLAGSNPGAKGGSHGIGSTAGSVASAPGGASASGFGTSKNSGGASGTAAASTGATGGGGAAGPNGAGGNSSNSPGGSATSGGTGNGGQAGSGSTATLGSNTSAGGNYGGGSGGQASNSSASIGAGAQGIIFLTWTPAANVVFANLAMMGM